jgi:hypothetical protein
MVKIFSPNEIATAEGACGPLTAGQALDSPPFRPKTMLAATAASGQLSVRLMRNRFSFSPL